MAERHEEEFLFLGDHIALDLLNTVHVVDGRAVDTLVDEKAVLTWLARAQRDWVRPRRTYPSGALVSAAQAVRTAVRDAILQRKSSGPVNLRPLNILLSQGCSHLSLSGQDSGSLRLVRKWAAETPEQLFVPLAEAAADLLAHGNFDLVRKCESDTCVLWFYDRTKSHHRRWCSVSTCGNRSKVAAFRKRRSEAAKKSQDPSGARQR